MKKILDKIRKYWVIYKENKEPIRRALQLAWRAWKLHKALPLKTRWETTQGYFKLGLAWGGFKQVKSSTT